MPSRIPSKSRKKGQWIKDVKGTTQGIPGIQWYPGAAVAELQASTSLFAFSSSSCIQPAIKGGKTPLATTSKTSKIPRDIKEIHGNICQCESASLPAPSSPSSRLDSCTCRSSKRRLSAVMAFPVHSAYLDWDHG